MTQSEIKRDLEADKIAVFEAKHLQLGEYWRPFKSQKKGWFKVHTLVDLDPEGKGKHPLYKNKMAVYCGVKEVILDKNQDVYISMTERQKRAKS